MAYADKLFEQMFGEHLYNLHTSMPCRVVAYYPGELKADLQPLFQRKKNGEVMDYPMISKAPVSRTVVIYPEREGICHGCGGEVEIPEHHEELRPGQTVIVVFAERALDFVGTRRHDIRDAVVIGVM